jgi:hypothetical protein
MSNLSLLSSNRLPEFIREEYPAIVGFVEAYYRFVESTENIGNLTDLDSLATKYVNQYRLQFTRGFSEPKVLGIKIFIRNNKQMFAVKGTEEAFRFFFKAYFGEEIVIQKPEYLIASGGEVIGDYFVYVLGIFGALPDYSNLLVTSNGVEYLVQAKRIERLDANTYAVYFNPPIGFVCAVGDSVRINDGTFDTFVGEIKAAPIKFKINAAGKYWQVGKVIQFPSSSINGTPTIARVTKATAQTGIASLEIVQYGYPHSLNQQFSISPFPARPSSGDTVYTVSVIQNSPRINQHNLLMNDTTDGIAETVLGTIPGKPGPALIGNSYGLEYFLEDYTDLTSASVPAVDISSVASTTVTVSNTDYSLDMWLESRATIELMFGSLSRERVGYASERSLISNQNVKIHDNYFYQAFSYLIKTKQNIADYRGAIELIHPAGLKFFAELEKEFVADFQPTIGISRSRSIDLLTFDDASDVTAVTDAITGKTVTKPLSDAADAADAQSLIINKALQDYVAALDSSSASYAISTYGPPDYAQSYWTTNSQLTLT